MNVIENEAINVNMCSMKHMIYHGIGKCKEPSSRNEFRLDTAGRWGVGLSE